MSFIGDIVGGLIQSDSTRSAANKQADASREAIAEQQRQYNQTRADYEPWRTTGANALTQLASDINTPTTAADVMADPGYQFGLDQGNRALNQRVAAAGGRVSGAALKAGTRYATDYASTGYGAAYQRKQDRLNRLAALAGVGQTATAGTAMAGQNAANQISGITTSQGDASAAAKLRQGSIWGNTANKLISSIGGFNSNPFPQWGSGGGFGSGTGGMGD